MALLDLTEEARDRGAVDPGRCLHLHRGPGRQCDAVDPNVLFLPEIPRGRQGIGLAGPRRGAHDLDSVA
jgi:hypothetical protein